MRRIVVLAIAAPLLLAQRNGGMPKDAASIDAGREIYMGACSGCHGATGEGSQGPSLLSGRVSRLTDQTLFNTIRNGLPGTTMPNFSLPPATVWQIAAFVRSLTAPAITARVSGDPARGRALFFGEAKCSTCHMILGQGGHPGPDLSNAGAERTLHQLRESILKPSERIEEGFRAVRAVLRDGRAISGVAKNYNNYSVQILDLQGQLHLLRRDELKRFDLQENSLMPTLADAQQATDIIAFLARQSTRGQSQ